MHEQRQETGKGSWFGMGPSPYRVVHLCVYMCLHGMHNDARECVYRMRMKLLGQGQLRCVFSRCCFSLYVSLP